MKVSRFLGLVLPSSQKLNFGLLSTINFGVVPFLAYALFPALLPFLNASWKSCFVGMFSTTCYFASIATVTPNLKKTRKSHKGRS
jgi:hypothetical protein